MNAVRYLFVLLPALIWPAFFSAHPSDPEKTPLTSAPVTWSCPAPAPATLIATGMTPTSLSLAWSTVTSGTPVYYKVEGYDTSGTGVLPTYITTDTFITYSNLSPGHTYHISVKASYCSEGPFGSATSDDFTTPTIIIDYIVQLQNPCLPGSGQPASANVVYNFCVQQSTVDVEPYNNGFVGLITYDDHPLRFAVANIGEKVFVGELNTDNPYFSFDGDGETEAWCYYGTPNSGVHLFTVTDLQSAQVVANLRITFHESCGTFFSCASGNPMCNSERQSYDGTEEETPPVLPEGHLLTQAVPNPFSKSTAIRYEVPEDAPVELSLYDATGRLVRTVEHRQVKKAGRHEINIDGADLQNGVYFLHAMIGQKREVLPLVKLE